MSSADSPKRERPQQQNAGTMVESVDEIRRALENAGFGGRNAALPAAPLPAAAPVPISIPQASSAAPPSLPPVPALPAATSKKQTTRSDAATPFRPLRRPCMAVLEVLEDGQSSGQVIHVYGSPFVIGRVEGDLVVEHDEAMSGTHGQLVRQFENGAYGWYLQDLSSTNGTFVRVSRALLKDGQEVLLGGRSYRFEFAKSEVTQPHPAGNRPLVTQPMQQLAVNPPAQQRPMLVELQAGSGGRKFVVSQDESWIGRDAQNCEIVLDDPMVSPRHAKIHVDRKGRWLLTNAQSLNGIWARVEEIGLGRGGQFQLGEQRFAVRIP